MGLLKRVQEGQGIPGRKERIDRMSTEYVLKTFMVEGLRVRIIRDDNPEPPTWDEENGYVYLVTTRNRYFEHTPDIRTWGKVAAEQLKYEEFWKEIEEQFEIFFLFAYIHSGVALSLDRRGQFADPWDAGQIGFVLVSKESGIFKDDSDATRREVAEGAVEAWNQYLRGDVWGYVIERRSEPGMLWTHVDSCWGIYGDEYCEQEAREEAKSWVERDKREEAKIARMMAL